MLKLTSRKIFTSIAVIVLLIFLHFLKILTPLESIFVNIFNPLLGGFYSISSDLRVTYNEQTKKKDLLEEIKNLNSQVNQLTVENSKLKNIEEENEALRDYINFYTNDDSIQYMLGNIIFRSGLDNLGQRNQFIIIDKGSNDGLLPGLAVISSQGIIIGKISAVKPNLSEVCLTTNPSCKLAATIQNSDKTNGIAEGELGLTISMNFIPQTENININDTVITSGLEQNIPRGLVIGKVTQVNKESNEIWQNAVIEPLTDLDNLIIVSVLLP